MNIEAIAGMLKVAGKKVEHDGFDKYSLLSLRGVFSPDYNYLFDVDTGEFARWGATLEDDPERCEFGNEILDLEISVDACSGACPFCYKSNLPTGGEHMSLATFKDLLSKLPRTLTQIAFGLTNIDGNPEFVEILEHARSCDVVPNFTTNGLRHDKVDLPKIVSLVGAIAVSCYEHLGKEVCYDAVRRLKALGLEQANIHLLYHAGNIGFVYEVLKDVSAGVVEPNAVVLLGLKQKGRGSNMKSLAPEKFTELIAWCMASGVPLGFDSCSCGRFLRAVDDLRIKGKRREYFHTVAEPCESGLFSLYVDVAGNVFPCSFTEGVEQPISILDTDDFVKDVWNSEGMDAWRKKLLANNRACPVYEID